MGVGLVLVSVAYGALDLFKERLFGHVRRAADPSYDPEVFDLDALGKWLAIEQVFDLVCVMVMLVPGWMATTSSWRFFLSFSLPKVRQKAVRLAAVYLAMERGYRVSMAVKSVREKAYVTALSHVSVAAVLLSSPPSPAIAGFLLLRQYAALWQSLFTLLNLDGRVSRKWFTATLTGGQMLLILFNMQWRDPLYCVMTAFYLFQCGKTLDGFFR